MRAISLTQPWASLVAIGAKQWETRSWPTSYRGQIAIHAAKGYPKDCRALEYEEPFMLALKLGLTAPHALPLGAIIALATITDCQPTSRFGKHVGGIVLGSDEWAFGDYSAQRYAFRLEDVIALETPIPCKGALSIWTVPDELIASVIDGAHEAAVNEEARGGVA